MERKAKTTLKDVAKAAGVSFTLVSKYVTRNPNARMTNATRERIAKAVKELNYRPSASARTLRKGRSKTVGLLSGDLSNSYWAHSANLVLRELRERGYQLLISLNEQGREEEAMQSLLERDIDGLIFLGSGIPAMTVMSCPMIVNDRHLQGCSEVNLDLRKSMEGALKSASGRIAGLFFENSLWKEAFDSAGRRLGIKTGSFNLFFDLDARREGIRAVCKTRPDAIMTSGWQTFTMLQEVLDEEFSGYEPKLYVHANCKGPFLRDPRIGGVIYSSATEIMRKMCEVLISQIEGAAADAVSVSVPTVFLPPNSREFEALKTKAFQLT